MFAVIKTGGKQYRVSANDTITIERLAGEAGDSVTFDHVLMVGEGDDVKVGAPLIEGETVSGEIVEQGRGPKVISFKKRRRQNSRRKRGHRQLLTTVRITEIAGVKAPASPKAEKTQSAPSASTDDVSTAEAPALDGPKDQSEAASKAKNAKSPLEELKGVGPSAARELAEEDITSFEALAGLSDEQIDEIDGRRPVSATQLKNWREQAQAKLQG